MARGVFGTGPYGQIRSLEQEINDCKYELRLIVEGARPKLGSKRLNDMIKYKEDKIRQIKAAKKRKK